MDNQEKVANETAAGETLRRMQATENPIPFEYSDQLFNFGESYEFGGVARLKLDCVKFVHQNNSGYINIESVIQEAEKVYKYVTGTSEPEPELLTKTYKIGVTNYDEAIALVTDLDEIGKKIASVKELVGKLLTMA